MAELNGQNWLEYHFAIGVALSVQSPACVDDW